MAVTDQDDSIGVETTATITPTGTGFDPSDPLYLHPSDNSGAMLVSTAYDRIGYRSWRKSVLRGLSVKNKLGFINGECRQPNPSSPQFRQWERCDNIVTSWILNSLSKEIADSVEYANDVVEIWKELEDSYEQTNGARLYQILKEINDLSQGTLDITTYYTKLKKLWKELATLNKRNQYNCICNCGAKESMYKAEQDRKLIQFLMGLNEIYTVVQESIFMMNPLPNLVQAFSLLVQDEKQREIRPTNHLTVDSASLNVSASGQSSLKTNFPTDNNYHDISRGRLICDYCKRPGHSKDRCYKLRGYPQNNQNSTQNFNPRQFSNNHTYGQGQGPRYNNKGKRVVASVQGVTDENTVGKEIESKAQDNGRNVNLTEEQYGQLASLLKQFHGRNGDVGKSLGRSYSYSINAANFAGMIVCTTCIDFGKLSCKCFESKTDTWILDSGASNHMTFNKIPNV
ncbi:uncharacterized protein LOC142165925 [Nicotiana tabacum]|uniref:Uncharacterized protein LOC142165925 n=1 Tax=Nicotiana tabacum TaxID=4097 RepID=A0AC58S609_TOBAC